MESSDDWKKLFNISVKALIILGGFILNDVRNDVAAITGIEKSISDIEHSIEIIQNDVEDLEEGLKKQNDKLVRHQELEAHPIADKTFEIIKEDLDEIITDIKEIKNN